MIRIIMDGQHTCSETLKACCPTHQPIFWTLQTFCVSACSRIDFVMFVARLATCSLKRLSSSQALLVAFSAKKACVLYHGPVGLKGYNMISYGTFINSNP